MPTLVQLVAALGPALVPVTDAARRAVEIDGVHISELTDPTAYLEGGEMLLTTGMPLTGASRATRTYVDRLVERRVGALVLGLGPILGEVPPPLIAACEESGLPLLVVGVDQAFITVTRAYWDLVTASGRASLVAQLGTQTALVREAAKPEGVTGVVSLVAQALGGWAAYVPLHGPAPIVWPPALAGVLPGLGHEVRRLSQRGNVGAATFPLHGYDVIAHPVGTGPQLRGAFAIGTSRRLSRTDRQLILTATAALDLRESARGSGADAGRAVGTAIATLLVDGETTAAHAVAAAASGRSLPSSVRVFAGFAGETPGAGEAPGISETAGGGAERAIAELERRGLVGRDAAARSRPPWATVVDGATVIVLSGPQATDAAPATARGTAADPGVRGALSEVVRLTGVPEATAAALRRAREARAGDILPTAQEPSGGRGERAAEALAAYTRTPLVETVRCYLRHRGSWEAAARELGVHRNTVRNRIRMVAEDLEIDLDDPDLAAELWIALRPHP